MRRRCVLLSAIAATLAGCRAEPGTAPAHQPVAVDLPLIGLDGAAHRLSHWRGRLIVLNVWASWCAPCRAEMGSLQALSERLDPARALAIGLSVDDDLHLVREYLRRVAIRFPIYLQDPQHGVQHALAVRALPATLMIGADGGLIGREEGARDWMDGALHARWRLPLRATAEPVSGDA
jgi:thiol-disulfide isomerase/thioredoxin